MEPVVTRNPFCIQAWCLLAAVSITLPTVAAANDAGEPQYNRDIRPILAENCFACHGADSAARKAGLRLDQREAAVEYGAIEPGDPAVSSMIERILTDDPGLVMPPPEIKKTLTDQQKQTLRRWVAAGAEYQPHWSLIPPRQQSPPVVQNEAWVRNPIDRFILARLESEGLGPAAECEPHQLFRRLHLDITGLPPEPETADKFAADYENRKDLALSEWIDHLMASNAWGEHRARYWLDAARYGDTHGLHFDNYREMWPYRDWVIRSFNKNQPFDRFAVEQLAGDLLPDPTLDQLVATGLQRCNITTNEGGTIDEENLANYSADRVQTYGWVFLGMTTNCAQCHDHKFDPITMRDYYALAAFFNNTEAPAKDGNVADGAGPTIRTPAAADRDRWDALPDEIAAAEQLRGARRVAAGADFDAWLAGATPDSLASVGADALETHLPLTEGAGDKVEDTVGSQAAPAATGPLRWTPDGKLGPAVVLSNEATLALEDAGDFEGNEAFSYGGWVRSASPGSGAGIIARMDVGNNYRGWDLWQDGGRLAVHIIDNWPGNALKVSTKESVVQADQWMHVLATYDGSGKAAGIRIYVNGRAAPLNTDQGSLNPGASIRTETPLRIGQRSEGAVLEGGSVQDVRIFRRRLSDAEALLLASRPQLRDALDTAANDRTPEQRGDLLEHFLTSVDPAYQRLDAQVAALSSERQAIEARSPLTHIQREREDRQPATKILMRGAYDQPGEEVTADVPSAFPSLPEGAPHNRLGLAQWTVDRANPLTARVTVNRFWQEVFGQGLVVTSEDFGVTGMLPSHPRLLDWLAVEFQDSGWDVKNLFKMMLMSAAYRQSAAATADEVERDPANALLARGPRFRMDAEVLRDTALASSGLLSRKMYGPGTRPYQPSDLWNVVGLPEGDTRDYVQDTGEGNYRRTVYQFWKRMAHPPNLEAFNAPSREVCTVRRERTNTPLQALVTLNDPQFVEAARRLAEITLRDHAADDQQALRYVASRVLCRDFTQAELQVLLADKQAYLDHYQSSPEDAAALLGVGDAPLDERLSKVDLACWTMLCSQVMNLDEALCK
ncbi:Planctomycete cytochrome C [Posidoniimonas polymericola]|uniref:Planctomycete cytochrome C n=1 Tax=Posidoniimonas polymericola TaxID=2528002 RepID=A0A5C5ZEX3_9BACT|nr:DUF1553 domain-containing protein [Posidoniimonas polymericola]TWT85872.1 Planctomycete cytochrome C [Posidoniimonas polymericola]